MSDINKFESLTSKLDDKCKIAQNQRITSELQFKLEI